LVKSLRLALVLMFVCVVLLPGPVALARDDGSPVKVVALGDSLTAGYGLPPAAALPARLQAALTRQGVAATVANAGVSGDTMSGGLGRLDWSVPEGTEAVIVALGANDALRGIDPKITAAALEKILVRLKERRIAVLLCGMRAPPNLGADFTGTYDRLFEQLAQKYDALYYPFLLDGVAANAKLNLQDGMHPNAAGVETMTQKLLPKVEELVSRARAARG